MPVLPSSSYQKPPLLWNSHLETVVPNLFRTIKGLVYQRETFHTADNDFFLLDWLKQGSSRLLILAHGLEGDSSRPYIKGMARHFYRHGWDVLAWNCRSCGGRMNNSVKLYHHGETGDLRSLIRHLIERSNYQTISLTGFSMGGSIILKYLGEEGDSVPTAVKSAVAVSVPCDLDSSEKMLNKASNAIYRKRFFKKLWKKICVKSQQFLPEAVQWLERARSFQDLHTCFTLPVYGMKSVEEFYRQGSANNYISGIRIPALIINALNDPMLDRACYPEGLARKMHNVFLEVPRFGGHVGFMSHPQKNTWSELRAYQFVSQYH